MKQIKIGSIRALISAAVLILFLLIFLGAKTLAASRLGVILLSLQFVPSLLKAVSTAGVAILSLAILVVAVGLFGRIYCSFLCPLGAFQDALIFLARKIKRKRFGFKPSHGYIWYPILFLFVLAYAVGSLTLIDLLDPYSLFGRISVYLFKPLAEMVNNFLVFVTESFDIYLFLPVKIHQTPITVFSITSFFFLTVFILATYHGRLYCNTLCPVGAFWGFLSRWSLFNFDLDPEKCTKCGKCAIRCKSGCIDFKAGSLDLSRCVSCFDCFDFCPERAVTYALISKRRNNTRSDPSKRKLILTGILAGTGLAFSSTPLRSATGYLFSPPSPFPATPPGSLSWDHFSSYCIACQLCVSVCHTHVLRPAFYEYGFKGFLQPSMDFTKGRCDYECNACSKVCPTDAIIRLDLKSKKRTQIGVVQFIKEKCIVYTKNRDCAACAEVCPTHAVYTVTAKNIRHPKLKPEVCVGCGACEFVCPVKETPKAIYVKANKVHAVAKPPFFQKSTTPDTKVRPEVDEEFPF
jgi:ferredoxin